MPLGLGFPIVEPTQLCSVSLFLCYSARVVLVVRLPHRASGAPHSTYPSVERHLLCSQRVATEDIENIIPQDRATEPKEGKQVAEVSSVYSP